MIARRPSVALLLSIDGGYVDTAGFLALQGLFTAHVTGNFVTLAAALVLGTAGIIGKIIALPIFCAVVVLVRMLGNILGDRHGFRFRVLLTLKLILLCAGFVLAVRFGPFPNSDAPLALATGMSLVAAMAVQNAVQRVHLSNVPPTTLMTGNTTQLMIDLADWVFYRSEKLPDATRIRLSRTATSMGGFAGGCALAALLYALAGVWCFAIPPVIALAALLTRADLPSPAPK